MVPKSCTHQSSYVNPPADPTEQDKLTGLQSLATRSNIRSNEAFTKVSTTSEASILPFIPLFTKNLLIKFMKIFIETTQA